MKDLMLSQDYSTFLVDIKDQIKLSQQKAFNAVKQEMILLYFIIGAMISKKQVKLGWGAKVIDTLSADILQEFPNMSGFSPRNLKRMEGFTKNIPMMKLCNQQLHKWKLKSATDKICLNP